MNKYYFVGIKGSGMSALAGVLHDLGNEVIGYDDNKNHAYTEIGLEKREIKIYYETPNITSDYIIVASPAFRDTHKELINAKNIGCTIYKYFEMLGILTDKYKTVAISGCHGKTTTTALLTNVINNSVGCSYIIGDGTGGSNKDSNLFLIEACEYKRHFLNYNPTYTIITNIELEHVDYYKDLDDMCLAYQQLVDKTKDIVIACGEDKNVNNLKFNKVLKYGFNPEFDVCAKNLVSNEKGSSFDVYINNEYYDNFFLPLYGKHMVLNALAVITICYLENIKKEDIKKYINEFKGAQRRFNETFVGDNVLIDDYAHHPTEVKAVISAARQKYPNKKLVAIFKPNTYTRTKMLYKDFVASLNDADIAYVTDIFCDRELQSEYPDITSYLIIDELKNGNHISEKTLDQLLEHKDCVFLFMSCKDIYTMKNKFEEMLKEN